MKREEGKEGEKEGGRKRGEGGKSKNKRDGEDVGKRICRPLYFLRESHHKYRLKWRKGKEEKEGGKGLWEEKERGGKEGEEKKKDQRDHEGDHQGEGWRGRGRGGKTYVKSEWRGGRGGSFWLLRWNLLGQGRGGLWLRERERG